MNIDELNDIYFAYSTIANFNIVNEHGYSVCYFSDNMSTLKSVLGNPILR